jgi:hypothetical protein
MAKYLFNSFIFVEHLMRQTTRNFNSRPSNKITKAHFMRQTERHTPFQSQRGEEMMRN